MKKYSRYSDNKGCRYKYFFTNKEIQSEDIAGCADGMESIFRSIYFNYLIDTKLLTVDNKEKIITPPILDVALECYLEVCGDNAIMKAIMWGWIR